MAFSKRTRGSLFYLFSDSSKDIPIRDDQEFKKAIREALEILFDEDGPYNDWYEKQVEKFLAEFCKKISIYWDKCQDIMRDYPRFFNREITFEEIRMEMMKKYRSFFNREITFEAEPWPEPMEMEDNEMFSTVPSKQQKQFKNNQQKIWTGL